ncbi:MAG: hypothetical protein ACFE0I_14895 [Elainellaceae cyanobacterium]
MNQIFTSEFPHETLNLFFPQWQGSARFGLYEGANLICKLLHNDISLTQIPVSLTYSLTSSKNILGYSQVLSQLQHAFNVIKAHNPNRIMTIGGDCSVEIAPVSFLNQRHGHSLNVIWSG